MRHQFFTIPALDPAPGQDELNRFRAAHRVVSLDKQFVADGAASFWSICVWWCADRQTARSTLAAACDYLTGERLLEVKKDPQINRSARGVTFCGFRILPGAIRLTVRKRRRYAQRRAEWEQLFLAGEIDANQLQCAYASVHAMTSRSQSNGWRREHLRRHPSIEV